MNLGKMYQGILTGAFIVALSGISMAADMPAGTENEGKGGHMMDEAMMAKWKEYSTPAEGHRILDPLIGNWEYTMKMWMDPNAPAEESTGTAQADWTMDGRFVSQKVQGMSMGQPFNGHEITGYDNAKKEYTSVWYDNMGTGMMMSSGTYDPTSKTITQTGDMTCPFQGHISIRWVTKFLDNDTYVFEGYTNDGKNPEFKSMEIIYKRK